MIGRPALIVVFFGLVNAGFVIAGIVAIGIRVVIGGVIVVRIPIRPRIKPEVEDDPGAVDETAMMSMPPVVAASVPITMPIGRMLRDDVISPVRRETVSTPDLACAISFASRIGNRVISSVREIGETIAAIDISAR